MAFPVHTNSPEMIQDDRDIWSYIHSNRTLSDSTFSDKTWVSGGRGAQPWLPLWRALFCCYAMVGLVKWNKKIITPWYTRPCYDTWYNAMQQHTTTCLKCLKYFLLKIKKFLLKHYIISPSWKVLPKNRYQSSSRILQWLQWYQKI